MDQALRLTARSIVLGLSLGLLLALGGASITGIGQGTSLVQVVVYLHEARAIDTADSLGQDDIYWVVRAENATGGTEPSPRECSSFPFHEDEKDHIMLDPPWTCSFRVPADAALRLEITLKDHDNFLNGEDDTYDISPDPDLKSLIVYFRPSDFGVRIPALGLPEFQPCRAGIFTAQGRDGDSAEIRFSIDASLSGDGDSDGDGLPDSWEVCGVDQDGDGRVDVDLPAMGANPYRKDIFLEVDWMMPSDGSHSHEPWLPALVIAWNEMNVAPVASPTPAGGSNTGIALHIDTGQLYRGYTLDTNGDGIVDISMNMDVDGDGANESLDLNGDGIPDIGALGALDRGTPGGGNQVAEDPDLNPVCDDLNAIRSTNFNTVRRGIFYYVLFGHRYGAGSSSGWGGCPGAAIVTLGDPGWDTVTTPLGPSGQPVKGTIAQHVGTLLHELGHQLGLSHGGGDGVNNKPNYLSIMSYSFQVDGIPFDLDGDGIADRLTGIDYDQDGQPDRARFMYSCDQFATLNESSLVEATGVLGAIGLGGSWCFLSRGAVPITKYGPTRDFDGDGVSELDWQQVPIAGPAIDWSRGDQDGDGVPTNDAGVSSLTPSPIIPPGTTVPTDLNNDGSLGLLSGFNDYAFLQNRRLTPASDSGGGSGPDITLEEREQFRRSTNNLKELKSPDDLVAKCAQDPLKINFEEFPIGTRISGQYPQVVFTSDPSRQPTIVDLQGLPTASPPQALQVVPLGNEAPLEIVFKDPQRFVAFFYGQTTKAGGDPNARVVLTAYDPDGFPVGRIVRPLPDTVGVTEFLGFGAILPDPDRFIARVVLSYQTTEGRSIEPKFPIHIDDLLACPEKVEGIPAKFAPPPAFGSRPVTLQVEALQLAEIPTGGEDARLETSPLPNVAIQVDGLEQRTAFSLERPEGTLLDLKAPRTVEHDGRSLRFFAWALDDRVFFPTEEARLTHFVLRPARLTALYLEKAQTQQPPSPTPQPQPKPQPSPPPLQVMRELGRCLADGRIALKIVLLRNNGDAPLTLEDVRPAPTSDWDEFRLIRAPSSLRAGGVGVILARGTCTGGNLALEIVLADGSIVTAGIAAPTPPGSGPEALKLQLWGSDILIVQAHPTVQRLHVALFRLDGRVALRAEAALPRLVVWLAKRSEDRETRPLSNGVYLVEIRAVDSDGVVYRTLRKLVLLR